MALKMHKHDFLVHKTDNLCSIYTPYYNMRDRQRDKKIALPRSFHSDMAAVGFSGQFATLRADCSAVQANHAFSSSCLRQKNYRLRPPFAHSISFPCASRPAMQDSAP